MRISDYCFHKIGLCVENLSNEKHFISHTNLSIWKLPYKLLDITSTHIYIMKIKADLFDNYATEDLKKSMY